MVCTCSPAARKAFTRYVPMKPERRRPPRSCALDPVLEVALVFVDAADQRSLEDQTHVLPPTRSVLGQVHGRREGQPEHVPPEPHRGSSRTQLQPAVDRRMR